MISSAEDQELIKQVLEGHEEAFNTLMNQFKKMVFTLCLRMLKNREEAEEAAQDSFVKVYKSLHRFKGESKLSTWIYQVTYRTCLDRLKSVRYKQNDVSLNALDSYQISSMETVYDKFEQEDQRRLIQDCLKQLPPDESFLLTLYYFDEQNLEEIAKIIGITANNVKVKLFRIRQKLASLLKERIEPEIIGDYERERK